VAEPDFGLPSTKRTMATSDGSATAQHIVTARVLKPLVGAAAALGVAPDLLLSAAGLSPQALDSLDHTLSFGALYALIEAMVEHSGDPALGLHLAERLPQRAFSLVADLVFYSPNLRESLRSFAKYQSLLSDATIFCVHEDERWVHIRCMQLSDAPQGVQRFTSELMVAGLQRRVRTFRPDASFRSVSFAYAAPRYGAEYERVFEGQACFDQPSTELVFDRLFLEARSPFQDPELHAALSAYGERKVRQLLESTSFAARVRQALAEERFPRQVDAAQVARKLRMSPRSLRRRLAAEGTSFAAVSDEALLARALDCLVHHQHSIQQTAFELGFSDKGAFHRAFKRWTGRTPQAFRAHAAANTG
jgi:AraC-like DNA-binding protein